ncbi:Gfo/Idh/MocA family protein [Halovenus marina]|uniref:Gfo/Idh/MocA family protein n=1 Tax=Halovenus marina TaxID=3396621 RepID=UPI003F5450F7
MVETVRIGVIGAGSIFEDRHFPALAEMDGVEVVAIANRTVESARASSERFDLGAEPLDSPEELIARADVDAVMVGTWPYKHHEYALAALDAGKHAFVQARMARSLAEAKEMYARSEETDLVTQICPSPLGMHGDKKVQRLIDDGFLGDLRFVRANVTSGRRADPDDPIHWRDVERYQGINALAVGILVERLHRWVGQAQSVSARTQTHITERPSEDGSGTVSVDLPDLVSIHCSLRDGAVGSFDFSTVTPHASANVIELYGSDGTIRYNLDDDTLYTGTADGDLSQEAISPDEAVEWTVEEDFVDAIRHGGSPRTTFAEGVQYMEFSEAVFRSAETGSEIHLPLRTS